jgi:two-component system sensor histidine kinase ChvG
VLRSLKSLRARALAVVGAVVVAPVVFVWLTSPYEDALGYNMRVGLEVAANDLGDLVRTDAPDEEFVSVAERADAWVRVLDQSGALLRNIDGSGGASIRERIAFMGDVPKIEEWDTSQPPLAQRDVFVRAQADKSGRAGRCGYGEDAKLLFCEMAVRVDLAGAMKPRYVYMVTSTPRALTSLYDDRYQVVQLTLIVLAFALILGLWLGLRIVRPLTRLRDQILDRSTVNATRPVEVERDDEFGELAEAFNALLAALEERRRANEGFMADMAHEIKNPVAAIRSAAESLDRGKEVSPERAARIANILRDSSHRLDAVVSRFLELARAESGLPEVERIEFDLGELVRNLAAGFAADERFAELEFDVKAPKTLVEGSPEHIETALRNLIANAASFADSRVTLRVSRGVSGVLVDVEDDGPGIAHEDLERVFDRFFTRRDDGGGTGLGLAMSRAIAEAHDGTITVESTPGEGTAFTLQLKPLDSM